MKLQTDKKSGLKYLFNPGDINKPTCVIFHGYGASAENLFPISDVSYIKNLDLNWIFIDGPLSPPEIAMFGGRAWFEVNIEYFQTLIREGRFKEYYSREPEGLDKLYSKVDLFLESMRLKMSDIILGGFSQGAMVATDYIYSKLAKPVISATISTSTSAQNQTQFTKPKALLHWSGTVIRQHIWMNSSLEGLPIFQSHGQFDNVLPVQGAHYFKSISKSKNHRLEVFQGAHEIPLETLIKTSEFLKSIL
jgi:phospholipase/carboxylesterase